MYALGIVVTHLKGPCGIIGYMEIEAMGHRLNGTYGDAERRLLGLFNVATFMNIHQSDNYLILCVTCNWSLTILFLALLYLVP